MFNQLEDRVLFNWPITVLKIDQSPTTGKNDCCSVQQKSQKWLDEWLLAANLSVDLDWPRFNSALKLFWTKIILKILNLSRFTIRILSKNRAECKKYPNIWQLIFVWASSILVLISFWNIPVKINSSHFSNQIK